MSLNKNEKSITPKIHIMKSRKTLKDFFKNCSNPELFRKVWNQGRLSFEEVKQYPNDYYAANSGAVPGMIYYSDTCKFAKNNIWLIIEQLSIFEEEIGKPLDKPSDKMQLQNWYTWFAWENMMYELINYLEE